MQQDGLESVIIAEVRLKRSMVIGTEEAKTEITFDNDDGTVITLTLLPILSPVFRQKQQVDSKSRRIYQGKGKGKMRMRPPGIYIFFSSPCWYLFCFWFVYC